MQPHARVPSLAATRTVVALWDAAFHPSEPRNRAKVEPACPRTGEILTGLPQALQRSRCFYHVEPVPRAAASKSFCGMTAPCQRFRWPSHLRRAVAFLVRLCGHPSDPSCSRGRPNPKSAPVRPVAPFLSCGAKHSIEPVHPAIWLVRSSNRCWSRCLDWEGRRSCLH
jgi:hypothetical protein